MSQKYNANNISVLEGLEPVRRRPGMYIGSTGYKGLNHLIYEIVDNSVDEHMEGFCDTITVSIEEDGSCIVEDNGRGIPVDMHKKGLPALRLIMTTLHAGGKFDHGSYKTSGGLHGVGLSVVNALSEYMEIEIKRDGNIHLDRYEKGTPVIDLKDGKLPITGKTKKTGTKIKFKPDASIFDTTIFKSQEIKARLHERAYLSPNLTIRFIDKREDNAEETIYHEPNGLIDFVKSLNKDKNVINDPICYKDVLDDIEVEVAIQYNSDFSEEILGFCNNIYNSEGGTHLTGFKTGLTTLLNQYAREIGVLKQKDDNFTGADIRNGISAIVSIKHPEPRFEGQTKTKLDNPDAAKSVSQITTEKLTLFFDRNKDVLKSILECAEKSNNLRKKTNKSKEILLDRKKAKMGIGSKIAGCHSKDNKYTELFFVEGKSAAGSAKLGRDRAYQAILPLRGKIINVEKTSLERIYKNEEIKTMIHSIGCGLTEKYGDGIEFNNLNYNKLIIMTDADVDGSHITTLLLTFFYKFMPELLEEGHVYMANPPLYKILKGKEEIYLYDDKDLENYRSKNKGKINLQRYKGLGEMDPDQLWETTMNPATRKLTQLTIDDARLASQITKDLMGSETKARKEFVEEYTSDNVVVSTI